MNLYGTASINNIFRLVPYKYQQLILNCSKQTPVDRATSSEGRKGRYNLYCTITMQQQSSHIGLSSSPFTKSWHNVPTEYYLNPLPHGQVTNHDHYLDTLC